MSAWTVHRPAGPTSPLVVHVPHAATWIPPAERDRLLLSDDELAPV